METPTAIVTGGEGDLAAGLIAAFEAGGYRVFAPGRCELEVRSAESVETYFGAFERIDVLVNNAGLTRDAPLLRQSAEERDEVLDTNLRGAHLCARAAAARMVRRREGHIVQIGSYSALHPPPGQTAYAAAKAGLVGLTKGLARELGGRNVRVNCVLPGFLETRMTAHLDEPARAATLAKHSLGRFNTVEEAARFIAFLATSLHVSGQVFQLDSRA